MHLSLFELSFFSPFFFLLLCFSVCLSLKQILPIQNSRNGLMLFVQNATLKRDKLLVGWNCLLIFMGSLMPFVIPEQSQMKDRCRMYSV